MPKRDLTDVVQIVTGLALAIGLVLVLLELRQSKQLTLAELSSQAYSEVMENARATMGENPAPTVARSCLEPEKLDANDMVVLSAYYQAQTAMVDRLRILEAVASFGVPWQVYATPIFSSIASTEPGMQWLQATYEGDGEIQMILDRVNLDGVDCRLGFTGYSLSGIGNGPNPAE